MSHNPHCTAPLHEALTDSPAFLRLRFVGYQYMPAGADGPADVIELRQCTQCGSTIGRELGIGARLARAESNGDISMRYRCKRALAGDEGAVRSYIDAIEMETLMARGMVRL